MKEELASFLHELVDVVARHDATIDELQGVAQALDRRTVGMVRLGGGS